jgi:protein-tyrosine phosphatase
MTASPAASRPVQPPQSRTVAIDGVFNVRDLGGHPTLDGRTTRWGSVFRADGIHRLAGDAADAIARLGVRRVVDLRTDAERDEHGVFDHADVVVRHVPLLEAVWSRDGHRRPAPDAELLLAMYCEMLERRGPQLATAAAAVAEAAGPVVFHCSAGKDRTGVLAALLLALVGVADDDIAADYAQSHAAVQRMIAELRAERRAAGGDAEPVPDDVMHLLSARPDTMQRMLHVLRTDHGGAEVYLRRHGLAGDTAATLRRRLLDGSGGSGRPA